MGYNGRGLLFEHYGCCNLYMAVHMFVCTGSSSVCIFVCTGSSFVCIVPTFTVPSNTVHKEDMIRCTSFRIIWCIHCSWGGALPNVFVDDGFASRDPRCIERVGAVQ
jgi:hypothetical protein